MTNVSNTVKELESLKDLIVYLIKNDVEGEETEQKRELKYSEKWDKAELIRDFISLANPPKPNYPPIAYLIVGTKNGQFFATTQDKLLEETDVRSILNSYVVPELSYSYHSFVYDDEGIDKWFGVFKISRTGAIHEVAKDLLNERRDLLEGETWNRRGSEKQSLNAKQKAALRGLISAHVGVDHRPQLVLNLHHDERYGEYSVFPCKAPITANVEKESIYVDHLLSLIRNTPADVEEPPMSKLLDILLPDEPIEALASMVPNLRSKTVSGNTVEKIRYYAELLDLERPEASFFDLGDLQEQQTSFSLMGASWKMVGNRRLKDKYKAIQSLKWTMPQLIGLKWLEERLTNTYAVTFALSNHGTATDEQISVRVFLPGEAVLCNPEQFLPGPPRASMPSLVRGGGALRGLVYPSQSLSVRVVAPDSDRRFPQTSSDGYALLGRDPVDDEFTDFVHGILNHQTIGTTGTTVIELELEHLRHNDAVAFAPSVLVRAHRSFELPFEIRSRYHPSVVNGTLRCDVPQSGESLNA